MPARLTRTVPSGIVERHPPKLWTRLSRGLAVRSSGGDRKPRLTPGTARKHIITLYMSEEEKDGPNRCPSIGL
jgi:hypothetical protein